MDKRRREEYEAEKVINENFDPEDLRDSKFEHRERGSSDFSFDLTKIRHITNAYKDLSIKIKKKHDWNK